MVRLLHVYWKLLPADDTTVSIPQWCDCCLAIGAMWLLRYWFQSHNGAIAAGMEKLGGANIGFQSHNGAIAAHSKITSRTFSTFQSHNGAIAAEAEMAWKAQCAVSFNPTMVRLLHVQNLKLLFPTHLFQSHNGAIAAQVARKCEAMRREFQSHNGAIAARHGLEVAR